MNTPTTPTSDLISMLDANFASTYSSDALQASGSRAIQSVQGHITKEASAILQNFFVTTSPYPTLEQKRQLLKQVAEVDPCCNYDRKKLDCFFNNLRRKAGISKTCIQSYTAITLSEEAKLLYPSLTEDILQSLDRLLLELGKKPSKKRQGLWAKALKVDPEHLEAYVTCRGTDHRRRASSRAEIATEPSADKMDVDPPTKPAAVTRSDSHLPSPSVSASPEPTRRDALLHPTAPAISRQRANLPPPTVVTLKSVAKAEPVRPTTANAYTPMPTSNGPLFIPSSSSPSSAPAHKYDASMTHLANIQQRAQTQTNKAPLSPPIPSVPPSVVPAHGPSASSSSSATPVVPTSSMSSAVARLQTARERMKLTPAHSSTGLLPASSSSTSSSSTTPHDPSSSSVQTSLPPSVSRSRQRSTIEDHHDPRSFEELSYLMQFQELQAKKMLGRIEAGEMAWLGMHPSLLTKDQAPR